MQTESINKITNGMSSADFNQLLNDQDKPFFDRAGQGRYSPASTIKPAIGLYGLENKIIEYKEPEGILEINVKDGIDYYDAFCKPIDIHWHFSPF